MSVIGMLWFSGSLSGLESRAWVGAMFSASALTFFPVASARLIQRAMVITIAFGSVALFCAIVVTGLVSGHGEERLLVAALLGVLVGCLAYLLLHIRGTERKPES